MSASRHTQDLEDSARRNASRAVWLKNLHQWHWISSALCLLAMILFSATGITLNHAAQIEAKPVVTSKKANLPLSLQAELRKYAETQADAWLNGRSMKSTCRCRKRAATPGCVSASTMARRNMK